MKIIAIIPARYDSTRFPGKPLALIAGKPMIQHVYLRAKKSNILEKVVVATDDLRIKEAVETVGGEAILTRKEHTCGTERIAEAAEILRLAEDDIVVNIQGDQPLLEPALIEELVRPLLLHTDIPMATVAVSIFREEEKNDPNRVKVVLNKEGFALYFSRSPIPYHRPPGESPPYFRHIGLYAYRRDFLDTFIRLEPGILEKAEKLEQLRALEYGYPIAVTITKYDCPEVDTPEDLKRVEEMIK